MVEINLAPSHPAITFSDSTITYYKSYFLTIKTLNSVGQGKKTIAVGSFKTHLCYKNYIPPAWDTFVSAAQQWVSNCQTFYLQVTVEPHWIATFRYLVQLDHHCASVNFKVDNIRRRKNEKEEKQNRGDVRPIHHRSDRCSTAQHDWLGNQQGCVQSHHTWSQWTQEEAPGL